MGKKSLLSDIQRAQITQIGDTEHEILVQKNYSKTSVRNTITKFEADDLFWLKEKWTSQKNKPKRWSYYQIHHFTNSNKFMQKNLSYFASQGHRCEL